MFLIKTRNPQTAWATSCTMWCSSFWMMMAPSQVIHNGSVAEPKLFIFGSGSTFVHNFGSGSPLAIFCHLKLYGTGTVTVRNTSQWRFFFILATSKLATGNIFSLLIFLSGKLLNLTVFNAVYSQVTSSRTSLPWAWRQRSSGGSSRGNSQTALRKSAASHIC